MARNDLFRAMERLSGMEPITTTSTDPTAAATTALVERFIERCLDPVDVGAIDAFTNSPRVRAIHAGFGEAFPDGRFAPAWRVVEGHRAVIGGRTTGTHLGNYRGVPGTGGVIDVLTVVMLECVDGEVVDLSVMPDTMAIAEQLGLVPALGPKACELVDRTSR